MSTKKRIDWQSMVTKPRKVIDWEEVGRNDLRLAAFHEAGHAVVCHHFGIPWFLSRLERRTATMETKGAVGQIKYMPGDWMPPFRLAVLGWAGVMAETLLKGMNEYDCVDACTDPNELSASDSSAIQQTSFRWRALTTAARILERRWALVEETATQFLERQGLGLADGR